MAINSTITNSTFRAIGTNPLSNYHSRGNKYVLRDARGDIIKDGNGNTIHIKRYTANTSNETAKKYFADHPNEKYYTDKVIYYEVDGVKYYRKYYKDPYDTTGKIIEYDEEAGYEVRASDINEIRDAIRRLDSYKNNVNNCNCNPSNCCQSEVNQKQCASSGARSVNQSQCSTSQCKNQICETVTCQTATCQTCQYTGDQNFNQTCQSQCKDLNQSCQSNEKTINCNQCKDCKASLQCSDQTQCNTYNCGNQNQCNKVCQSLKDCSQCNSDCSSSSYSYSYDCQDTDQDGACE